MTTEAANTIDQLTEEIKRLNSKIEKLEKAAAYHQLTNEKLQDELIDIDKRYPELFNNMSEGFAHCEIICDDNGIPIDYRVLDVNKAYEIQTGIKAETIVGKTVLEVFPDIEKSWINIYGEIALTQIPKTFINFNQNTGKYYETTSFSLKRGQFSLLFRDITIQKLTEQNLKKSEKRYSDIISGLVWAIAIHIDNKIVFVNDALKNLVGISNDEEIIGRNVLEFVHPEDRKKVQSAIQSALSAQNSNPDNSPNIVQERLIRSDGSERIVEASVIMVNFEDEDALVVTLNDITDRKLAEKALSKSEAKYRLIAENTQDIISLHAFDHKLSLTYVSPSLKIIGGYMPEELLGQSIFDLMHPDDKKGLIKELSLYMGYKLKKMLTGHNIPLSKTFEFRMKHKSGNWLFAQSTVSIVGSQLVSITRDITAAKKAETILLETNSRHAAMIENIGDVIAIVGVDGITKYQSPNIERWFGWKPEEIIGTNGYDKMHPDDVERIQKEFISILDSKTARTVEYRFRCKDDSYKWIELTAVNREDNPAIDGVLLNYRDISNRKKAAEKLTETISLQRATLESTADGILVVDLQGRILDYNNQFIKIWGMPESMIPEGKTKDLVAPENAEFAMKHILEQLSDPQEFILKVQSLYNKPEAESFDVLHFTDGRILERFSKSQYISEEPVGRVWSFRDVTAFRKAQQELQESEEKYKSLVETASDAIYLVSENGTIVDTNQAASDILGKSKDEIIGSMMSSVDPNFTTAEFLKFWEIIPFNEQRIFETTHIKKDGTLIPVEISSKKHKLDEEVFYYGIARDITERKQAERTLKQSEAFNREIVDNSFDCIKILDLEANIQFMSKGGQKLLKIKNVNDYIGKSWFGLFKDMDRKSARAAVEKAKSEEIGRFKSYIPKENGIPMWWDAIVTTIVDEKGKPASLLAISRDITKETQIAIELKKFQSNLISLINNTENSIWSLDSNYNYIIFNKAYATFFYNTYGVELKKGMNAKKIMKPDEYNFWVPLFDAAFKGEKQVFEFPHDFSDGKHYFQILLNPIYEDHNVTGVSVMNIDITKSMQNVTALKESESRFKALHNASFGGIAIHDKGLILDCNLGLSEITGYQVNELIGMDGLLLIAEESQEMVRGHILAEYEKPYEAIGKRKNGEKYPIRLSGRMIPYKGQKVRVVEFRDITEQKKSEEEIYKSETRFRELVENITSGVAVYKVINDGATGADYIIKDFNKAALLMEGLRKEEIIGKSLLDLRPNIDEFGLIPILRKTWKTGKPIFFPAKQYIDNKYQSYYENRVYRLPGGEIVAVYDDVTERENAAMKIAESRNRFDLAMNASKDGLFDWNLVTNEIYYSPGWKSMLGYKDDELPNDFTVWEKLTDPEHIKKSWEMQQELINNKRDRFELEFKMKHKKGHWVDILSRAEAVFDESGKAIRVIGTHVDISGRKKAEEEIYRLKNAVDDSFFGVIMATMDGTNFYMNNAAYTLFGYDPEQDYIEGARSGVGWAEPEKFNLALQQLKAEGLWQGDVIAMRKDGSLFDCYTSATVIKNLDGEPQHLIAYYLDITDRKQAEEAVKKLNEELEKKVIKRTENLENKNKELARMNKLFVGRELRMVELKQMIKELEGKLTNK